MSCDAEPAGARPGDAELVSRMRGGDTRAYEELYRRHSDAVRRYVRHCCRDAAAANDLTDEVFARMLLAVPSGGGPDTAVRTHLLAAVRDVAATWTGTSGRDLLVEEFAVFAAAAGPPGGGAASRADTSVRAMRRAERSTAVRAFRDLPERWQVVLWHTVIEDESPRDVAPLLGLTEGAVAVLAQRAREGLQQSCLTVHTAGTRAAGGDCARRTDRLGTYVRGGLRARADRGLRRHLERCADCRSAALDARDVCERLRLLLPLAVVGWGADVYSPYPMVGSARACAAQGHAERGWAEGGEAWRAGSAGGLSVWAYPVAAEAGPVASGGVDSAAGSGAAAFDGLGSTAKAGITAGVMAAAVAAALTLALVADGQRLRGSYQGPEARPSATDAPGGAETGAEAGGSRARAVSPREAAGMGKDAPGREPAPAEDLPGPGAERDAGPGSPYAPGPPAESGARPGAGAPSPGSGPAPGGTAGPTTGPASPPASPPTPPPASRPSATTVHRLDRLPRGGGSDGPSVREGSGWLWQRSQLRTGGRDRGYGVTVPARSSVSVDLGGACVSFDALAGVDDLTVLRGAVRFSVYGDGVRLWESGVVRRGGEPVPVHVPLAGVRTLRLVVEPNGVLDSAVMAAWARARIGCR
ncbi:sigma-70 family RNA polymerase sigma factor [Streptomyces sp. CNQ085]|uniref:sigma-70 family RNA polymerase sigma factor n=1 Tax=Streptomyces sp. CNQ085 TaxID=2886944 RepID=UPI001F5095D9|nr:sigma-70 family RNA polymerase sigma factor [Streptomyces sp. CNQ085]MCI0386748.1 sigma-70 family RNA polymerase sigma factor [Streptomyces sp. CNQ085]